MLSFSTASSLPELSMRPSQGAAAAVPTQGTGEDFAGLLGRLAADTAATMREGEAAAIGGVQGGLPLQTVVDKVMAAERTLQAALAVRDKAVGAYQEITRMQI